MSTSNLTTAMMKNNKILLAQINPSLGDLKNNTKKITDYMIDKIFDLKTKNKTLWDT